MSERSLDLTIISAKGLNNVNLFGKMAVYAIVYIKGNQDKKQQKTHVDKDGDSNPTWNCPMKFMIDEHAALQNRLTLVVKIKAEGMFGDKDVGEVYVPVKELLESGFGGGRPLQFVTYQVRKQNGKPKGELSFSYKFCDKFGGVGKVEDAVMVYPPVKADKLDEPVTAYPAVGSGYNSVYPPLYEGLTGVAMASYPPSYPPAPADTDTAQGTYPLAEGAYYPPPVGYPQMGYVYQQQPAYGIYPPPPALGSGGYPPESGYGYPPVQQPQKNKFGLGLGAGMLGGLLIGDIVSDAGNSYGGGCGGGCGGF